MARKPVAKTAAQVARRKVTPVTKRLSVRVTIDPDTGGEPYYANYAEIATGQYDAELIFARTPAKPSSEQLASAQSDHTFTVPATVRLVLPIAVLEGLRDAIDAHLKRIAELAK